MTLLDRVTFWMRKEANKHGLLKPRQDMDDYIRAKVNAMSQYELLEAISEALEQDE